MPTTIWAPPASARRSFIGSIPPTQVTTGAGQDVQLAVAATGRYDFILSPTSPILPYAAELAAPGNDPHNALPHIAFTVPYNMSEQPAASINWRYSAEGLPIGIQLVGKRFDDAGVLKLAKLAETLRPRQRDWPDERDQP